VVMALDFLFSSRFSFSSSPLNLIEFPLGRTLAVSGEIGKSSTQACTLYVENR